ncbi:glycosyltransferase [Acidovorax sp. sic0104]|uniref:glycosyltransferase n=1 Tax=Acidovorax sp. sic0104 TaxID=2854784 RepID=UPI001C4917C8|nr:glycosyltransferase [Acidovorax sp. sic0104]MBV7540376.1 glycosyltransferase [Acidovorax sp. sic0104]
MRVLFVSDYPHLPSIKGGLQTTTHDLCHAIGVAGATAAVLCGQVEGAAGTIAPSVSDTSLGYLCMRAPAPLEALPLVAAAWQPDTIVVQSGMSLTRMVLASLDTGRPTVVYLHNVESHQLGGRLVPDPRLLYLANSHFTAQRWRALAGLQCAVIPPVVQADSYLAGASGDKVLFVNPVPIKGVELMFALAAHCPDIPFLVVESWNIEPVWRDWCRRRAQSLGNIEWLEPVDDMRPVYARSRLLLMPSVWEESFGRTSVEAQLNGMPVLASDRGALPEIVGRAGTVLDPHAPVERWADALRSLLAAHEDVSAVARRQGLGHAAATPLIVGQLLGLLAGHAAR